jgi:hypothetical protein
MGHRLDTSGDQQMNVATLSRRYGREPVSAYIGEGWRLMPLEVGGVAFHRVGRSAITVGAPLGPEADAAAATTAFRQHCRSKGWRPVVFQAATPVEGLRSYRIAREAYIDVAGFTLSGSAMANARHSVSRARRDGMTVSWRRWSNCGEETRRQMKLLSGSWSRGRPELTFTYGRLEDIPDDAWVVFALAAGGRMEAFSTWRPLPAGPGLVLDLMRRRVDSTPGAVELMIVDAVELARSQDLGWLSLGSVCESDDLPRWLRIALASAAACGGSGLVSFKEKFRPRWEDRYLALPDGTGGIAALLALAIAHLRGAKVSRKPAKSTPQRRPALRWAAAAGITAGLSAYGLGAAAADIGLPVVSPIQMTLSAAFDGVVPEQATGPTRASGGSSPPAHAGHPPAKARPNSAVSHVPNTGVGAGSTQVAAPGPSRAVSTAGPAASCTPAAGSHPVVAEGPRMATRTRTSPRSGMASPPVGCGPAATAPAGTGPGARPTPHPPTPAPTPVPPRPTSAPPGHPVTPPPSPPPASKKTDSGSHGHRPGEQPVGVSQSAHNTRTARTEP